MLADGGGLYFRKRKHSASWVLRRTQANVTSSVTIARFPETNLSDARKLARSFQSTSTDELTVADLLQDWYDQNERIWRRPEQMEGYVRRLTKQDPLLVASKIQAVDLSMPLGSVLQRFEETAAIGALYGGGREPGDQLLAPIRSRVTGVRVFTGFVDTHFPIFSIIVVEAFQQDRHMPVVGTFETVWVIVNIIGHSSHHLRFVIPFDYQMATHDVLLGIDIAGFLRRKCSARRRVSSRSAST